jgi:diguanylate cyclase (GGDEF)-like protein/PAS domain S-box-containing protein
MTQGLHAVPELTQPDVPAGEVMDALRLRLAATWYWRQNAQWRFVQVDEICACIGIEREDWLGHTLWETPNYMTRDFWESHREDLQARRPFNDLQCEVPAPVDPSATLWLQISGEPITDVQGEVVGYHGFGRDVTAQKRMELALRGRELRLRSIFEQSPLAIIEWDTRLRVRRWNVAAERIFGWSRDEILGRHVRMLFDPSHHHLYGERGAPVNLESMPGKHVAQNVHKLGHEVPCSWSTSLLHDDHGKIVGAISVVENLTERKLAESLIEHMGRHDALTNLPNRSFLLSQLDAVLAESAGTVRRPLAVLVLNMDRFKQINEAMGHAVGDQVLYEVARRLNNIVPRSSIVARLAGDEFAVVLRQDANARGAHALGEKLHAGLSEPYRIENHEMSCSTSIGVALFPDDGQDAMELLSHADAALSHAKEAGRNQLRFFSASLKQAVTARREVERDLGQALRRGELMLHFQPQVDAASGAMVGAEALLRWNHPTNGPIAPVTFIPIAESADLIVEIGAWALDEACRTLRQWQDQGVRGVTMAVNLSAHQLRDAALVGLVERALERHGLRGEDLELELTESAAMEDPTFTIEVLNQLRQLDVKLSIDDFGTGYSSLSYLKLLPIHRLKLDQSFVREIETEDDAAICISTIALAHKLRLQVVAEGVCTEVQRHYLSSNGCDVLQGYLFSQPVSAEDAMQFALRHSAEIEPGSALA